MIRFPLRASIPPINPNVANELHIYSILLFATTFREFRSLLDSMPAFEEDYYAEQPRRPAPRRQVLSVKQREMVGPGRTRTYNR